MANKKGGKNVKDAYKKKTKKKNEHIASEETRKQAKSSIKKAAGTIKDVFTPKKSTSSGKIETSKKETGQRKSTTTSGKIETSKKETGQRKSTTTRNERSGNSNVARSGAIAAANVVKDAYKKNTEKANSDVKNGKKVVSSHYGDVYNENTDAVISKKDTKKAQDKFGTGKGLTGGAVKGAKSAYDKSKGAQDNLEKAGKKTIETKTKDEKEEAAKQQRIYNWKHGEHSRYAQMYDWLVENGGNVDGLSKKDWIEKQRLDTKDDRQEDAELAVEESSKFSYTKAPVSTDQMMKQYNASLFANNSVKTKTNDDNYVKDKNGNIQYAFSWDKDGKLKMTPKTKGKTKVDTTQASNIMDYYNGAFNKKGQLTNQDASTKIADQRAGWIHDAPAAAGFMQGVGYADIRKGIGQFSDAAAEDVNKVTMEGGITSAWNLGYMGGFVAQMGIGGVNSMAKSLTKAGAFKTARGALAATAAKSAAIETPVNILDSIKMATDANGNTNYKAAAGYMALNTLMSGGIPAIMEGAGGLIKKHESKELLGLLAKEQELAKVGRSLPEIDMAKYDKLVGKMTKAVEDQMSAASVIAGKTLDDVAKGSPDGFIKVAQAQVKANAGAVENSLKKVKNLKGYDGGLTDGELKAKGMYRNANGEVETKVVQLEGAEDIVKAEALKDHYAKTGNAKKVMEMEQALSNARVSKQGDEIFESARQMQRERFAKDVMKKADITDERSAVKYVDDVSNAVKNKAYIDGKDMEGLRAAIEHAKQTQNDALLKSAEGTLREAKELLQAEAKALERRFKPLTKKTGGNIVVGTSEDLAKVLADNGKTIPEGRLVNGFRVGNDIYVNIESPERHSFTIAHELTHIMEDNAESFGELINLVKKFDEKAWADELKNVSEVYSGVTDNFEKEVAGNVLGKLIADQDFLRALYKKDANLFQKIYDFLRTVVTGTDDGFTVPKEYEDIYKAWDNALNELGGKKAGNVDLSIIPEGHTEGVLVGTKWTTDEADKAHPQNNFDYSLSNKKATAEVDRIAEEISSEERGDMAGAVKEYEALQKERDALPNDASAVDRFEEIEERMENLFKSQEEYETAVETLEKSASEEVDAIAKANESDAKVKKMLDDYRPISESLKEYGIDYTTSGKVYKIEGIGEYKMRKKGEFPAYYTRSLHDDSWVGITPEALPNNLTTAKRANGSNKVEVPTQNRVDVPTKEAKPVTRETADDFDEFTADGKPKTETSVKESTVKDVVETTTETAGKETADVTPKEAVALAKKSPSKEEYNATAIRMHDDAVSKYGTREEVREMINKNLMDSVKYNGKSAKEAEAQAKKELEEIGFTELKKKYLEADFNDDPKVLVARWNKLAEYIDKQIDAGKDAAEWYAHREEIDLKCTQISNFAGRGTQAMKDILTSTRAGRLRVLENEIKKLKRQYHTRIDGDLTIDNELLERLAEAEGAEKEELLHEINKQLWEQIPASLMERINEYRHCFMLFNVKTHGRNIIGNGTFRLARAVSDYSEAKMFQSKAVKGLAEKKGIKLEVDKVPVLYVKDVKPNAEHLDVEFKAIYKKSNSRNKYIETGRPDDVPVVKWKLMQKLINADYGLLEKQDLKGALRPAFDRAYVSWCKARLPEGKTLSEFMSEMTDAQKNKARHYALVEGEYASFRDSCAFSDWLIGRKQAFASKNGKTPWGTMGYRALDIALEGAIPFVKTPVNIFRRSLDFSPFGIMRGAVTLATAKNEAAFKSAIHDLSTGMTGTAMCGFGAFLAAQGFVTVKAGEKSGDKYYDSDMGFQDYSINVGGHSWTLDWAQPMQMSFFAGAAFIKGLGDGWKPEEALNMFFAVTSPLTDTSFMSSPKDTIGRFVENAGRGTDEKEIDFTGALAQLIAGDIPKNYISGMIPQLVAQTAGFTDVYNFDKNKTLGENFKAYGKAFINSGQIQRDTRGTSDNAFIRGWQSAGRQLLNKVPVLRQMYLNPKLDRRGNDKVSETTKSDWNIAIRLANAFANPASVKEITFDKTDRELIKIRNNMDKGSDDYRYFYYNFTGNPSYNLADVKGFRDRQMTYDEAYTYGKANRIKQNTMIEDMINAKSYKGMTWKMKADEVSDAHWVGTTVADLKTYGANYAVRALLKNNEGEKDDFTNYKVFKGTSEATSKAFVEYFIEKETMIARAHCDSTDIYKIKAAIAVRKGDKELLSAIDIHNKVTVEDMTTYISKMRGKAKQSGEKLKKLIFDDITDFTCSAASHIDAAGVNSSTSAKSLALGICAADGDKKAELTYRGMGYTWNKAQAGGGLALKYGVNGKKGDEALAELTKIKAEVRRNDPDGSGSYTKEDVTTYIDKKMKNASADEKACMFESLSNGYWKNPYKAEVNDHLKWGENRDGEWGNGKSGHGWGPGWGHGWGHGGGGGSGKGKMPKTDSGAIKGKVSNPFSNTSKPSNLDDAYRKKLKKLREQTR